MFDCFFIIWYLILKCIRDFNFLILIGGLLGRVLVFIPPPFEPSVTLLCPRNIYITATGFALEEKGKCNLL